MPYYRSKYWKYIDNSEQSEKTVILNKIVRELFYRDDINARMHDLELIARNRYQTDKFSREFKIAYSIMRDEILIEMKNTKLPPTRVLERLRMRFGFDFTILNRVFGAMKDVSKILQSKQKQKEKPEPKTSMLEEIG